MRFEVVTISARDMLSRSVRFGMGMPAMPSFTPPMTTAPMSYAPPMPTTYAVARIER